MTSRNPMRLTVTQSINSYFVRHFQTMLGTLGRLYANPVASFMTILVIGVALALPAVLQLIVNNGTALGDRWDNIYDISVFMKAETKLEDAHSWAEQLRSADGIAETQVIPKEVALEQFKKDPDFGDAVETLEENPLPHVVVVRPSSQHTDTASITQLKLHLQQHEHAEIVQSDGIWINRFNRLVEILRRSVLSAFGLLALAVILIVGNTIRLDIENRRDEIIITKLVGGSNGFIRRPFLYYGCWYGFVGGICALIIVIGILLALGGPVQELASLYSSDFRLSALSLAQSLGLVFIGTLLGWLGAWLAAQRHIYLIEPR